MTIHLAIAGGALFAALAFGATGASAQDAPASSALARAVFAKAEPAARTSLPARPASAMLFDKTNALRAAGVARTAVDRNFSRDVTGALGFLCGRPDNLNTDGAADAQGHDPHGRFLGAKLSMAF